MWSGLVFWYFSFWFYLQVVRRDSRSLFLPQMTCTANVEVYYPVPSSSYLVPITTPVYFLNDDSLRFVDIVAALAPIHSPGFGPKGTASDPFSSLPRPCATHVDRRRNCGGLCCQHSLCDDCIPDHFSFCPMPCCPWHMVSEHATWFRSTSHGFGARHMVSEHVIWFRITCKLMMSLQGASVGLNKSSHRPRPAHHIPHILAALIHALEVLNVMKGWAEGT